MSCKLTQPGRKRDIVILIFVVAVMVSGSNATADFTLGEPINLGAPVNTSYNEICPHIWANGLEFYFSDHCRHAVRPGGFGESDMWVARRATVDGEWGQPENLGATFNTSSDDASLYLSADGLEAYFVSKRPGGFGGFDIWVSTRETKEQDWGEPRNLGSNVNSANGEICPSISGDGLSLYFSDYYQDYRPGGQGECDLYVTTRATTKDDWGEAKNLGPIVNSSYYDAYPSISDDGRTLFFGSGRPGGEGHLGLLARQSLILGESRSISEAPSTPRRQRLCVISRPMALLCMLCPIGLAVMENTTYGGIQFGQSST
jgi:Tol biopolymer transport system component